MGTYGGWNYEMEEKKMLRRKLAVIVCGAAAGVLFGSLLLGQASGETSTGWTITSYQDANEAVYDAGKIEVFDSRGNSLGYYKSDFLSQVQIDGSGKGDGIQNPGKFLHYDYNVDDGKTYYLSDKTIGAYGTELVPWTGDKPSVAVNPPLPKGTRIRFKDLGPDAVYNPAWVNELLLNTTFYSDDKFAGVSGKRIDVYVGLQKVRDMIGTPESLWMQDATISTEPPCTPTGIPETICNGIDDNCDGVIDEGCVPPLPPPNNTPNNTVPNATAICQYASSASATSENAGSEAKYATGAPDAPYGGNCNVWSGSRYSWNPRNWNIKANITLGYNKAINASNFTIYGDYDVCWKMMWLKNSASGKLLQVFSGYDKNCISTHKIDSNFPADTVILETCGWSWSSTDAVQLCGR